MPEPFRRKRFQIHLSTAVVMMFVAGALLWANLIRRGESPLHSGKEIVNGREEYFVRRYGSYGWPFTAYFNGETLESRPRRTGRPLSVHNGPWNPDSPYVPITLNVSTALFILFAVCFLSEYLIRRAAQIAS